MAFYEAARQQRLRLHVRIDERSASFTALGLAKASRPPVAVLCTSGTAAANFHPAVIEADESGVPLARAHRRPARRSCAGSAPTRPSTRSSCTAPRCAGSARPACPRPGRARPATGARWPARPGRTPRAASAACPARSTSTCRSASRWCPAGTPRPMAAESLDGRPGGQPWTRFPDQAARRRRARPAVDRTRRGRLRRRRRRRAAPASSWPGRRAGRCSPSPPPAPAAARARCPPTSTCSTRRSSSGAHQPDLIVSAGGPGSPAPQLAFLKTARARRHVVVAQGPGRWADPQRAATDVAAAVRLTGAPAGAASAGGWLDGWQRADEAARRAVDAVLDDDEAPDASRGSPGTWPPRCPTEPCCGRIKPARSGP